ncbi:MAG: hypothetical protein Q4G51_05940 [Dermatophilus congolensis]|nr:hypothetical protein [Dermatophilus congolensis]
MGSENGQVWFDPGEWPRISGVLAGFEDPWLPLLDDLDTPRSWPEQISESEPTFIVRGIYDLDDFVGETVPVSLAEAQGWDLATLRRFIVEHWHLMSPGADEAPLRTTWAVVAAYAKTPIYVEERLPSVPGIGRRDAYLISARGEVLRAELKGPPGELAASAKALRTALFSGPFDDIDVTPHVVAGSAQRLVASQNPAAAPSAQEALRQRVAEALAAGPQEMPTEWDGNDVDAMLKRAEFKVVAYTNEETPTGWMADASALQAWGDEALKGSPLTLEAYELDTDAFGVAHARPSMLEYHVFDRAADDLGEVGFDSEGFTRMWCYHALDPWMNGDAWFKAGKGHAEATPYAHLIVNGTTVEHLCADECVSIDEVRPFLRHDPPPFTEHRWFVLHIPGTTTALAFPRLESMLQIDTDEDGAWVNVRVRHQRARLAELEAEKAFRITWARWLDPRIPLTPEEIDEARVLVEAPFQTPQPEGSR